MSRTLREQLFDTFRTDQDFDAFCQDFFSSVYRRFGKGMERVEKTNLLFALIDEADIVRCLTQLSNQSGQKAQAAQPGLAKPVTAKPAVPTAGPVVSVPFGNPLELTIGHVKAACARLTTADAQGTGYLVRPDRLVTCAHVVHSVGIGGNVQAQFIGNAQVVDATVERLDDTADWAVLKLAAPVDGTQNLPIFSGSTVDARWLAFGYPAMAGEHGIALGGVVRDPAGKDSLGRPAVQLFCDEAAAARGAVLGGASGSPVISGGRIIGHLRRLLPDEENRAQLGILFACPSLAYQSALPALSEAPQLQTLGPQSSYDPLWYIPRLDAEKQALNKLSKVGIPVTLQAPEGYGKGWMVQHLIERIVQQDLRTGHKTEVVRLNLRKAMSAPPASLEELLMSLLRDMLEQLGVERLDALLARASKVPGDAKRKFRRALEQHVLSRGAHRSLIILEEADHLHRTPIQTDFFALLRAMAEDKTPAYKSLRLLVTIGAEAAFLETTDHSAFFALSKPIVLEGFSFPQLQSEAALYGLSPDDHGLRELHRLSGGYPQYAQQAMHEAVCSEKTLAEVLTTTDPRGGLFASSLQRLRLYIEREGLRPVLQKLLTTPRFELSPNDYLRLYRKGLVIETSPGEYRLRCPLFDDYFRAWCR